MSETITSSQQPKIDFTHLHVHSQYSLLDGKATIKQLVDKAIADGMPGIALTDHGNMYGIKEFFNYVGKVNSGKEESEKFKPVFGCEMYVARERLTDKNDKTDNGYHLIVLAKNLTGYKNLIKLVSKAWTDGMYYKPRTDRYELAAHKEGLIICSACLGGEVPQLILKGMKEKAEERVAWFKATFGDDYYIELQRHQTDKENANRDVYPEQVKVNEALLDMARRHGIKVICTNDVHFAYEYEAEAHDRLLCISTNKKFTDPRMHYTKQEWLKSPEEMMRIFSDIPEALANTREILDKVEYYSIDHGPIMPTFEIPEEFGTEEGYRKQYTEQDLFDEFTRDENGNVVLSKEEADKKIARLGGYDKLYRLKLEADYLKELTMQGARERYGEPLSEEVKERLNFELYIMKTMGFPGYFLIVQDFINTGRRELGVSVGPGRGSAAGSAAAYCLGITQIDPIKYDLLFERFLNPDRISLPDIDVDFDDDGRGRVLNYVTEKYGAEKVAHIITYQTMATKSSLKDMARVMDLSVAEGARLAKLVPDHMPEINGKEPKINISNMLKYCPEFAQEQQNPDPRVRDVVKYAEQLEGNVRGTGIHACGVIICRDDITDWVPVSVATDTDGSKVHATMYEGSVIEETGLIKMDFLGLKTLSIIKEALYNIKHSKGIDLDIDHIPLDDPATFKLYSEGRTTSTFQFESAGMQNSLRGLKPTKFEDLIAMNALYRPGPMAYIPSFIARKQGIEPIEYDIPIMKKYLEETYGITVYQEQVMLLSRLLANFTRGESDMLRKAMGKKQLDKMAKLKVKFMSEGEKNGHNPKTLEKIWNDWEAFAKYAFNKSHATCYTWVAYQTAYLKANYPAEYMAAVMSRNLGMTDKLKKNMDECRAMGLTVKGPDVNESRKVFAVSSKGEIRFGLAAIKGVGAAAVEAIIEERDKNGPYKDIYDMMERIRPGACNRASMENLALAGAFDLFGVPREAYVADAPDGNFAEQLVKYNQRLNQMEQPGQMSLFDGFDDMEIETEKPAVPPFAPWDRLLLLEKEKELVTIYLSAHPLDPYYMELTYNCNCTCAEFEERRVDGAELTLGGLVTAFQERTGKSGKPFGILSIEDFSGKTDIRLFGKTLESWRGMVKPGDAVFLHTQFQSSRFDPSYIDMNIKEIARLDDIKGKKACDISILIDRDFNNAKFFETLQQYMLADPASHPSDRRPGRLTVSINDPVRKQRIHVRSRRQYNVCRDLCAMLDEWGVAFKVE